VSRPLITSLALLALSACEPPEEECYGTWGGFDTTVEEPDRVSGLAVRTKDLSGKANIDAVSNLWAAINVSNESVDEDCVIAIYASSSTPDVDALPVLDPEASPPDEINELGTLLGAANLAANRASWPDSLSLLVELPAAESGDRLHIVVATCAHAEVIATFEYEAEVCSDWGDEPNLNDIYDRSW
jgi:hypothetical protein